VELASRERLDVSGASRWTEREPGEVMPGICGWLDHVAHCAGLGTMAKKDDPVSKSGLLRLARCLAGT